jgi:thiamine pyrophosphate-dependent acetolactate synthase large subunit-like protein
VRAYKIAMTPPMMPVVLVIDGGLQEDPIAAEINPRLRVPKLTRASAPQGDSGAIAEAARLLVDAQNPVIVADRAARTPAGLTKLIELAETLQAPVINQGGRMNFPTRHPLNQSANARQLIANADVIVGLELTDFWGTVNASRDSLVRTSRPITRPGTKLISVTALDLNTKGNYQDFQRYPEVDIAMAADAEATLRRSSRHASGSSRPSAGRHSPNVASGWRARMPRRCRARARRRRTDGTRRRSAPLA